MGVFRNFIERIIPLTKRAADGTIIIDIPASLYYKELAIYTATSLISNAISRSEIRCYENGKPVKNRDYYLLNISPNANENSSIFWHKVINNMVRKGEALVVDAAGALYCADGYTKQRDQPIKGDVYLH